MIRRRRLLVNALVSAIQVLVVAGTFFVLYRFLRDAVGEDEFGVWALVLATTSAGSVANLGLAASAVKFVSQYLARDDRAYVARLVQTATLSVAAFLGVVLLALYPLLKTWLLPLLIEPADKLPAALSILPYALVAFWLTSVAGVFQSCIDGLHRIDLRGVLVMGAALAYLALAFLLVPTGGLVGIAQAQVLQAGLLVVVSWGMLKRLLPALPLLPYRWHRPAFREMLGYSLNFQAISVAQLLLEPTVKSLMSKFGGVGALANFEFAYRMVFQARALLVTAHQAVVPTIAEVQEKQPALLRAVYTTSYRLLAYLVLASLPLLLALTPLISRVWIGVYEPQFVLFATLIFVGWFLNLTANPAYFANVGTGELRWNVLGHFIIGGLSAGLGLLLGRLYGGTGVVAAYVVAIVVGSLSISLAYQRKYRIRFAELVQRETLLLAVAAVAGMALALYVYIRFETSWSLAGLGLSMTGIYLAVVVVPLWRHPMRRQLTAWLAHLFTPRRPTSPPAEP